MVIHWSDYPHFSEKEFKCSATGECNMHPKFMSMLSDVRRIFAKPMFISSGFRSVSHPLEAMKDNPGEHTYGMAADIVCNGVQAICLLEISIGLGFTRIGLNQKGRSSSRFIHLGIGDKLTTKFQSAIWTY